MQLTKINILEGKIKLVTGLHIGAGNEVIEIGGLDQPIIKHPITQEPYIPGSSIKGKMRSLLEIYLGKSTDGKPCSCGKADCPICPLFGVGGSEKVEFEGPTRIVVRDSFMTDEWKEKFGNGELTMEVKYENTINRIKGTADKPRPLERIPSDVDFEFSISVKEFDIDNGRNHIDTVLAGLAMIEEDGLGGNVSRGCGQVKFEGLKINEKDLGDDWKKDALSKLEELRKRG